MKKLFVSLTILFVVFMFVGISSANPFLKCDLQDNIDEYILVLNTGDEISTPSPLNYDLKDLPVGAYVVTVWAKRGVWRSLPSTPLEFTKPLLTPPILRLDAE